MQWYLDNILCRNTTTTTHHQICQWNRYLKDYCSNTLKISLWQQVMVINVHLPTFDCWLWCTCYLQDCPEWTYKTWYLKPFYVQLNRLAQPSSGAVYNEFIQGSAAFELDQTAINPTLWKKSDTVALGIRQGFPVRQKQHLITRGWARGQSQSLN